MKKITRLLIAVALVLGVVALAGNHVAWADTAEADLPGLVLGQGRPALSQADAQKGSVVPPPATFTVCSPYDIPGVYSVGGVATLHLDEFSQGYCVGTILWNHRFAPGRLPDGAGGFLSEIVFVRIYLYGNLVDKVSTGVGDVSVCFALPPDKEGQIYFYDFYGPRFFHRTGQPAWVSTVTTNENGIVCTTALASGAYALVGY
ncbi:MAG: hypothetical protein GXP40_12265 [Chloroflexi bacterium]|nr:hypothetical protein [Chloroflexota bacterium]